jgi:hypothetical protein
MIGVGPVTSIRLTPATGQELLALDRRSAEPEVRLRTHILLLLDAGHPWATIGAVPFCSGSTIGTGQWKRRFEAEGDVHNPDQFIANPVGLKEGLELLTTADVELSVMPGFKCRGPPNCQPQLSEHSSSFACVGPTSRCRWVALGQIRQFA